MKIKDPNDPTKEIEVYTKEEIEAAKGGGADAIKAARDAAIEEYKRNNPDKSAEAERLKNELASAKAELEAAQGMDGGEAGRAAQIQRLKEAADKAEKALTDVVGPLQAKVAAMETAAMTQMKNALLDRLVGNDKDAREKVLLHFDKYDPTNTSPEGIEARMTAAVGASGVKVAPTPGPMDGNGGMGGQRGTGGHTAPVQVTDNAKAIGKVLGNTPEEIQKHVETKNAKNNQ